MLLILNVDLNGKVTKVELDKPKTGNNSFEQCILKEFRQLQFPSPKSGKNAKITVKLIIK